MVFDKQGNLYGVATNDDCCEDAGGFVFRLSKGANGTWSENVIYKFTADEGYPYSDLATDSAGNLYGVTYAGEGTYYGEVFKLSPTAGGTWKGTILYTFPGTNDIGYPAVGVTIDGKGNLYGPAYMAYIHGNYYGAVYELSPRPNGPWKGNYPLTTSE